MFRKRRDQLPDSNHVYDKADWHFDSAQDETGDTFGAYVHGGLFLGWLVERNLLAPDWLEEVADALDRYQRDEITGPRLFQDSFDGCLSAELLSEDGNRFAYAYYEGGQYYKDCEAVLDPDANLLHAAADTAEHQHTISRMLDSRYTEWQDGSKWRKLPSRA